MEQISGRNGIEGAQKSVMEKIIGHLTLFFLFKS